MTVSTDETMPIVLVEAVEPAPFNMFAAKVIMPDKSKVTVLLSRRATINQTVEFSLRAAATVWSIPGINHGRT